MPPATMVSRLGHSTKKKSLHKALFDSFFKIRGSVKAAQEPRLLDAAFEFELNGRWRGDARAPLRQDTAQDTAFSDWWVWCFREILCLQFVFLLKFC